VYGVVEVMTDTG